MSKSQKIFFVVFLVCIAAIATTLFIQINNKRASLKGKIVTQTPIKSHGAETSNITSQDKKHTIDSTANHLGGAQTTQGKLWPKNTITLSRANKYSWWHDATIYQVWVRSFYDSDGDGNGDFKGLSQKLDYIKRLGVDAIWLAPIFESPSYHGYDTSDFYKVEKDYGSMEDFEHFIAKAKEMNIKVVIDLVLNHVSEEHPWFLKSIQQEPEYKDFFVWQDTPPEDVGEAWGKKIDPLRVWHTKEGRKGYYYGVFGWSQPDLNYRNPLVVDEAKAIAKFWLEKGVDGFRLDAIRYLIEGIGQKGQADTADTLAFWRDFKAHVKAINPEAMLVGEAFAETDTVSQYYDNGKGLDQAFDFSLNPTLLSILEKPDDTKGTPLPEIKEDAAIFGIRNALWNTLKEKHNYESTPGYFFSSFLNNHDYDRLNSFFGGDSERAKIAASLLLTTPGSTYVYYGEEIGMSQYDINDDMYRRSLMQWDATSNAGFNNSDKRWLDNPAFFPWLTEFTPWWSDFWQHGKDRNKANVQTQETEDDSLLEHYRTLITLRKQYNTIRAPEKLGLLDNTGMAWITKYQADENIMYVIINLNPDDKTSFTVPDELKGDYINVLKEENVYIAKEYILAPGQTLVLQAKQDLALKN